MAKKRMDEYVNRAIDGMSMSAANTLTFEQMRFGVGLFQGIALVIHRVDFTPSNATLREIVAATDNLTMAITTSNQLSAINDDDSAIIVNVSIVGVGVAVESQKVPISFSFENMPGGGLIVSPNPLYMSMATGGFVAAAEMTVRLYHTFIELSDKDYIELIQSRMPTNI